LTIAPLHEKTIYVNCRPIGRASTWVQVHALLGVKGVHFVDPPTRIEGRDGFYLQGELVDPQKPEAQSNQVIC
jgi:hypothetical protein